MSAKNLTIASRDNLANPLVKASAWAIYLSKVLLDHVNIIPMTLSGLLLCQANTSSSGSVNVARELPDSQP